MEEQNSQSRFLSAFETAQEMLRVTQALVAEVIKLGGSEEDLKGLLRDQRRLRRTAEAILGKGSSDLPIDLTGPDEYRVSVTRGRFPSGEVLTRQFSRVDVCFTDGTVWKKHRACLKGSDDPVSRMKLYRFSNEERFEMGGLYTEKIINWGLKRGLRPADRNEVYSFGVGLETEGVCRETSVVGLGEYIEDGYTCRFPGLGCYVGVGRALRQYTSSGDGTGEWSGYSSFLFVCV
jgi:hypothetical protein